MICPTCHGVGYSWDCRYPNIPWLDLFPVPCPDCIGIASCCDTAGAGIADGGFSEEMQPACGGAEISRNSVRAEPDSASASPHSSRIADGGSAAPEAEEPYWRGGKDGRHNLDRRPVVAPRVVCPRARHRISQHTTRPAVRRYTSGCCRIGRSRADPNRACCVGCLGWLATRLGILG